MFDEIGVPIEVESELVRAGLPHCRDGVEIPVLAASHERHRRAASRRFRYRKLDIHRRNDLEAGRQRRRWVRGSEEERQVGAIARGVFNQLLYERASEAPAIVIRSAVEHCGDPADGHELPIKSPGQVVPLGAGEHLVALHQRESAPMTERPGCLRLEPRRTLRTASRLKPPYAASDAAARMC